MKPPFEIHMENCIACDDCRQACATALFGRSDPSLAVFRVRATPVGTILETCEECGVCASVCPRSAIEPDARGILTVRGELCSGCGQCVDACPSGLMRMHPDHPFAVKCRRCGQCVMSCRHNVFQMPSGTA